MIRDPYGRPVSVFKTLRQMHVHNLDSAGLNDLTEAFSSFMTRARFFTYSLRRTWSHSAIEFMKYRRRLPALASVNSESMEGNGSGADAEGDETELSQSIGFERARGSSERSSAKVGDLKRVFVSNISFRVTNKQLASFFGKFGTVTTCSMPAEKGTIGRKSRGVAFVTFSSVQEAQRALTAKSDELMYYGKTMTVSPAAPILQKRQSCYPVLPEDSTVSSRVRSSTSSLYGAGDAAPDAFAPLPDKVLIRILQELSFKDRIRIERVCKRFMENAYNSWQNVEHLNIGYLFSKSAARTLQTSTLKAILHRCGAHIVSLDLSSAPHFLDDTALGVVGEKCPLLTEVNFTGIRASWQSLKEFAEKCPHLQRFKLQNSHSVSDKAFWWLFKHCRYLKSIDISGCKRVTGRCLRHLGLSVEELILDRCGKLDPSAIESVSRQCINLIRVQVSECPLLNDACLSQLCRCETIEVLHLNGGYFPELTRQGLGHMGHLINLVELSVESNPLINDDLVTTLTKQCSKLLRFNISGAGVSSRGSESITDALIKQLAVLESLEELEISYLESAVTDKAIKILATSCTGLKILRVRGCHNFTHLGAGYIAKSCKDLWELDMSGCMQVDNRAITAFDSSAKSKTPQIGVKCQKPRASVTLVVGGTGCLPKKLNLSTESGIILDTSDYSRHSVSRASMSELKNDSSLLESEPESDVDFGTDDGSDDEFSFLSEHPSFILHRIEEDDSTSVSNSDLPCSAVMPISPGVKSQVEDLPMD